MIPAAEVKTILEILMSQCDYPTGKILEEAIQKLETPQVPVTRYDVLKAIREKKQEIYNKQGKLVNAINRAAGLPVRELS